MHVLRGLKAVSAASGAVLDPTLRTELPSTGWGLLEIMDGPPRVRKRHPEVQLDLSCIVEGYALQCVDALLRKYGSARHLINISGEVLAVGAWSVGVQVPDAGSARGESAAVLPLEDVCVATSGSYRQPKHLIDPRSGGPVHHALKSVSVFSADAMSADAWATALMIHGPKQARRLAAERGINALFFERAGE
jgi:thiamine biosynthesis lipoprotein